MQKISLVKALQAILQPVDGSTGHGMCSWNLLSVLGNSGMKTTKGFHGLYIELLPVEVSRIWASVPQKISENLEKL